MNYPTHLLPNINYKIIAWTDDLLPLYLIRHTPTNRENLFLPGTRIINPDAIEIPSERLSDLSTNLLGESKIDDVYIKVTNNSFLEPWVEGSSVITPYFNADFCIDNERGYFYWKIQDIITCSIKPTEIVTISKTFDLSFEVKHTPKRCNFWHFSISVFADNTNVNSLQISEKQKRKLWRTAKVELLNLILTELPDFPSLHQKHYIKSV
jgi:hypothetical protein